MKAMPLAQCRGLSAAVCLTLLFGASVVGAEPQTRPAGESQTVEAANRLGIELYRAVVRRDENLVISPYCTFESLAVLNEGAAGKTAEPMNKVLGLSGKADADRARLRGLTDFLTGHNAKGDTLICNIAGALWVDKGVTPNERFLEKIRKGFGVEARHGDFAAAPKAVARDINEWVGKETRGKIKDLCRPTDLSGIQATLVNTVYFNGKWNDPFDEKATRDHGFHASSGKTVQVRMMHRQIVGDYYHGDGIQLVALPYSENEPYGSGATFEFVLLLPDEPRGLTRVEETLDLPRLSRWIQSSHLTSKQFEDYLERRPKDATKRGAMQAWASANPQKEVRLDLPRFSVQTRTSIGDALRQTRAAAVVDPNADFSRTGIGGLGARDVVQMARIDVDEKGTEAAAAQENMLFGGSSGAPVTVTVDHPFLYLIRESNSGVILFMGRVCDPS